MTVLEAELVDIKARLGWLEAAVARLKADTQLTDPPLMVRDSVAQWEPISAEETALASVPAMFDGERVVLLVAPPSSKPYHVLVTFVAPVSEVSAPQSDRTRFWASFGAWQDDRANEEIVTEIHAARHSRSEPPAL